MENSAPAPNGQEIRDGRSLLLKVRFNEWLSTDPRLTANQLRVAIYLVNRYNFKVGYCHPPYDGIADALGICRRTAFSCVQRLLELKKLVQLRQGRGKGIANWYRPNFEAIPEGCVYRAAMAARKQHNLETVQHNLETVQRGALNGATALHSKRALSERTKKTLTVPLPRHLVPKDAVRCVKAKVVKVALERQPDIADRAQCSAFLRTVQTEINTGRFRAETAADTYEVLGDIMEAHDSCTGDPIGGWAYRLSDEVSAYLPDDDEAAEWVGNGAYG